MLEAVRQSRQSRPSLSAYCVGAVLVDPATDCTVAAGFSRELPGNTHAEQCAIDKLPYAKTREEQEPPRTALTLYTTMEPCTRRLSGLSSCTDRILAFVDDPAASTFVITRVVVGVAEPPTFIADCTGVTRLRDAPGGVLRVDVMDEAYRGMCLAANAHLGVR